MCSGTESACRPNDRLAFARIRCVQSSTNIPFPRIRPECLVDRKTAPLRRWSSTNRQRRKLIGVCLSFVRTDKRKTQQPATRRRIDTRAIASAAARARSASFASKATGDRLPSFVDSVAKLRTSLFVSVVTWIVSRFSVFLLACVDVRCG